MWNRFLSLNEGHDSALINLTLSIYNETIPQIIKQFSSNKEETFRSNEIDIQITPLNLEINDYYILAQFNKKKNANLSAILSILRTIFVCVMLAGAAIIFSKDATDLVLTPLENMLKKINNITTNPLEARKIEEDEAMVWERLMMEN